MNTEEIKMIVDMIAQLGTQGKEAFIWWLVMDKVLPWTLGFMLISSCVYFITRIIRNSRESDQLELKFREWCDTLGSSYFHGHQRDDSMRKIGRIVGVYASQNGQPYK